MPPYFQWQAKRAKKSAASERQSHAPHFRVFFRVPTRHALNRLRPCCMGGGGGVTFNIRMFENCKAYFNFTHNLNKTNDGSLVDMTAVTLRGIEYGSYLTGFKNCELPGGFSQTQARYSYHCVGSRHCRVGALPK